MVFDEDGVDRGTPGGSLMRTYEQRRTSQEERIRSRHPRMGGLLLALSDEPATTANFKRGATAEVSVAQRLQRRCGPEVELLFNRRLSPRGRDGDIDILAVAPNGVHVIDVKRYKAARVRVRRSGGLLLPLKEQLLIGGRDHTRLLDSVHRQQQVVRGLLSQFPTESPVPLHTAFCFVDADLPLISERIGDVALLGSKGVARRLNKPGPLEPDVRDALLHHLARHLPSA
jgi:hypothetical protein